LNATKKPDSIAVEAVQLGALESKACSWYSAIPSQLQCSSESLLKHIQLDTAGAFIFIHVIHHANLAVLYYSLALSIAANPLSSSSICVTLLTCSALEHANAISKVIPNTLVGHVSRTPGFVGHALHCDCHPIIVCLAVIFRVSIICKTQHPKQSTFTKGLESVRKGG
jgi:hypothetical protein